MNIGLYQSAASLTALERWQDVVTQNITSGQVAGYKKRTIEFGAIEMGELKADPSKKKDAGGATAALFPKVNFGVNFQPGEKFPTGRALDVALEGEGFFVQELPDGNRGYSRAGEMRVRPDRTLVSSAGNPMLSDAGNPLTLLPTGGEISISADGMVSQGGQQIGRLGVVNFPDLGVLSPLAGGVFTAREGVDPAQVARPQVIQGQVESSNVTPLREMVALVQIARAYEANQKMISTQDQTLAKALETLG